MAIAYTKAQLIERVNKHLNDTFPGNDWKVTSNECLLYIDSAIPFVLKGQIYENAKVFGVFEVPDAYLVSYELTSITRNSATNEWKVTLPQTPLELPTGYNITDAYLSQPGFGRGQSIIFTKTKRVPYRDSMPLMAAIYARIETDVMYMKSYNGMPLNGQTVYVQMPISRTDNINDIMSLPDGAIEPIFNKVVATILQRYQIPQDTVADNLPPGNKSS
jgi:hypothetical protein